MTNSDQLSNQPPSTSSSAVADPLDQDVGCPACGYNLRGLGSDRVACPECGLESDVAELLKRAWTRPWYKAPGYTRLCLPSAWALVAWIGLMIKNSIDLAGGRTSTDWPMLFAGMGVAVAVWAGLMVWPWRSMGGPAGAGYALLAHVALFGYLLGVPLVIGGVVLAVIGAVSLTEPGPGGSENLLIGLMLLAAGVGLFFVGRWLERVVAGHCIRMYLRRPTTS